MIRVSKEFEDAIIKAQFEEEHPDTCPGCFRKRKDCRCGEGPCH
jgi:hypothetical protein